MVVHDHAPVLASAVHAEPTLVQLASVLTVSDVDDATLYDSCTLALTADVPENVSVRAEVMLSVSSAPESFAAERSGVVGAGTR